MSKKNKTSGIKIDKLIIERLKREPLPTTTEELAKDINVSRDALAKHLKRLEEEGIIFGKSVARLKSAGKPRTIVLLRIESKKSSTIRTIQQAVVQDGIISSFVCIGGEFDYAVICSFDHNTNEYKELMSKLLSIEHVDPVTCIEAFAAI